MTTESHESINTKTIVIEIITLRLSPRTICVPVHQVPTIFRHNEAIQSGQTAYMAFLHEGYALQMIVVAKKYICVAIVIINDQKQDTGIREIQQPVARRS